MRAAAAAARDLLAAAAVRPLRALVANAGAMSADTRLASADGYEMTFAVNYLRQVVLAQPRRGLHGRQPLKQLAPPWHGGEKAPAEWRTSGPEPFSLVRHGQRNANRFLLVTGDPLPVTPIRRAGGGAA